MTRSKYPIHGYSLGMAGTKRSPLTWFRCGVHGQIALGSPNETPHHCGGAWGLDDLRECGDWEPVEQGTADAASHEALDHKPDLIARFHGSC
jgi:hypothetical protein